MSTIQKVFLAASCIFFAATIYSLFNFEVYLIVLFFLLHSLCLIFFSYRTYADLKTDEHFMETYHQDIGMEIAEKNKEVKSLKDQVEEKEEVIKKLEGELLELRNKCIDGEARIKELEIEKTTFSELRSREKEDKGDTMSALLPPVDEESSADTVDIIELAGIARDELLEDARSANMTINISSAMKSLKVKADRNRLIVLFRNIIDNSIKYMKKAGALVVTISTIGDDIFIVLKDTGEGLNEDETKHIFELNFQGSNRISGNGLGLAQAKAIVDYYGGIIYAKSTEGKGMGIYIQLPA